MRLWRNGVCPIPGGLFYPRDVNKDRAASALTWFVGVVFIALGVIEVVVRVVSRDPVELDALAFWSLSLCGGGALVLLGAFVVPRPSWGSFALIAAGCLAGTVATMWTLLLPVLAAAVLVLAVPRRREGVDGATV